MSVPARLLDSLGRPISVADGENVKASKSGALAAGVDENQFARLSRVESFFGARVRIPLATFANRFYPLNDAYEWRTARPYTRFSDNTGQASNGLTLNNAGTPTAATTLQMVSLDANDAPGGTGAWALDLVYWAVDGKRYTQSVVPNGTTPVNLIFDPAIFFVDRFFVTSAGSSGVALSLAILDTDGIGAPFTITNGTGLTESIVVNTGGIYVMRTPLQGTAFTVLVSTTLTVYDYINQEGSKLPVDLFRRIGPTWNNKFNVGEIPSYIQPAPVGFINFLSLSTAAEYCINAILEPAV